jgi:general secretion pathway protein E
MGVETFLLSTSLLSVMAQRLVRLLCRDCAEPFEAGERELELLGMQDKSPAPLLYRGKGCEHCNYTGYRGRTGIYELIEIDETLRKMIHEGAGEQEMLSYARLHYPGIEADGRRRILSGETSLEEVLRVTAVT